MNGDSEQENKPSQGSGQGPVGDADPVTGSSLSGPLLVCSILLFVSLLWGLYDELIGERPWKRYQSQFVHLYTVYLKKLGPRQAAAEKAIRSSAEYRAMEARANQAEKAVAKRVAEIERELSHVHGLQAVVKDPFQDARARMAALTYELDHTAGASGKRTARVRSKSESGSDGS